MLEYHINNSKKGGLIMEYGNNTCQNIFLHKSTEELKDAFTDLWVKVINECERNRSTVFENLQTKDSKI